jgi:hypothetical protein
MLDEPHTLLAGSDGYAPSALRRRERGLEESVSRRPQDREQISFAPFDFGAKRIIENACGSIDHEASLACPEMNILPVKQHQEHRAAKFRKIEARKRVEGTRLGRLKFKTQSVRSWGVRDFSTLNNR